MERDVSTTGDHVSLLIDQLNLQGDEQSHEALLDDIEEAVEEVIDEYGLTADRIRTIDGHTYTSIGDHCPECGNRLKLV